MSDWMTPQLRALTAQFDAVAAEAKQASREASATARAAAAAPVTTTAEYQRLEQNAAEYFRSGECGQTVRALQERVDRGDLTWRQIRDGDTDPEATRTYRENQDTILTGIAKIHRDELPDPGDDPDDDEPVFRGIYE
jgi:hypothetical protein